MFLFLSRKRRMLLRNLLLLFLHHDFTGLNERSLGEHRPDQFVDQRCAEMTAWMDVPYCGSSRPPTAQYQWQRPPAEPTKSRGTYGFSARFSISCSQGTRQNTCRQRGKMIYSTPISPSLGSMETFEVRTGDHEKHHEQRRRPGIHMLQGLNRIVAQVHIHGSNGHAQQSGESQTSAQDSRRANRRNADAEPVGFALEKAVGIATTAPSTHRRLAAKVRFPAADRRWWS